MPLYVILSPLRSLTGDTAIMIYHIIAETERREIKWEYDAAAPTFRAWRTIKETGATHDTVERIVRASLYRNGRRIEKIGVTAKLFPFKPRAFVG
jgi:hypothetical protein